MLVVEHSGGGCGIVGLLPRFLHVDSSHSGLITTNGRGLAGAQVSPGGRNYIEKKVQSRLMASAPFDWSPVKRTLVGSWGGGRDSQLSSLALIIPRLTQT